MKKVFDYKEAVKKVKNYQSKDKVIDLDCDAMNIIIRGDVKIVFWDYDRMSPPDKVRRPPGACTARRIASWYCFSCEAIVKVGAGLCPTARCNA